MCQKKHNMFDSYHFLLDTALSQQDFPIQGPPAIYTYNRITNNKQNNRKYSVKHIILREVLSETIAKCWYSNLPINYLKYNESWNRRDGSTAHKGLSSVAYYDQKLIRL